MRFASHETAQAAVCALARQGRDADLVYNERAYDGAGGRGWSINEQGASSAVVAHLTFAKSQSSKALPERLARAQSSRPKVIELCIDGTLRERKEQNPHRHLRRVLHMLEKAVFTGKGDRHKVRELIGGLDCGLGDAHDGSSGNDDADRERANHQPKVAP